MLRHGSAPLREEIEEHLIEKRTSLSGLKRFRELCLGYCNLVRLSLLKHH